MNFIVCNTTPCPDYASWESVQPWARDWVELLQLTRVVVELCQVVSVRSEQGFNRAVACFTFTCIHWKLIFLCSNQSVSFNSSRHILGLGQVNDAFHPYGVDKLISSSVGGSLIWLGKKHVKMQWLVLFVIFASMLFLRLCQVCQPDVDAYWVLTFDEIHITFRFRFFAVFF